ncbi:MAG: hypothetical protein J2P52_10920 [Blastocatellia bacterium]|nr:hypothetical protein [Blastocatellia bacterium]
MRNFFSVALIFNLIISAASGSIAQSAPQKRASIPIVGPTAGAVELGAALIEPSLEPRDELVAMLPASDLVAVVDFGRAFNELLPKLAGFSVGGLDKLAKSIQDFTLKTGIDPSKIQSAVAGMTMEGSQGIGVVIIQGIDPDPKQIEAAMKEFGSEFKTSDYNGKTIYNVASKVNPPSAGSFSLKTDEFALAALGRQKVALGDLKVVKQVIDIQAGAAKGGVSAAMAGALKETRASALVRFALNIPENLRSEAANQGDLFKSVATIKMILGTFDVASDFGLSLDTIIRTASQNDATDLENGLKGLVSLGRDIFAGGADPKTHLFAQLLDQVKIGSKVNDVSLSINLSREILEQLTKKETPPPAEKK